MCTLMMYRRKCNEDFVLEGYSAVPVGKLADVSEELVDPIFRAVPSKVTCMREIAVCRGNIQVRWVLYICLCRRLFLECPEDSISSETSPTGYQLTRRRISEDEGTYRHRFENLTSPQNVVSIQWKGVCGKLVHLSRFLLFSMFMKTDFHFMKWWVCVCWGRGCIVGWGADCTALPLTVIPIAHPQTNYPLRCCAVCCSQAGCYGYKTTRVS